jgi:hypothetical protein
MYPASTVIALWNMGVLARAELISYLGIRPEEPLDVLQDPVLQAEVEEFRRQVADGVPLVLIQSHC